MTTDDDIRGERSRPIDLPLAHETDLAGWRDHARALIDRSVSPERASWRVATQAPDLFAADGAGAGAEGQGGEGQGGARHSRPAFTVPRQFIALASEVVLHRDPARFGLLYTVLWRFVHGERDLLAVRTDPQVDRALTMASSVRRDIHKMKGFVRFREVKGAAGSCFVSWFEPEHFIVEETAPFFAGRFTGMRWSIVTPDRSAYWDGARLTFGPGASRRETPAEDPMEAYWRSYYASIFNPARLNTAAMKTQMPMKYWKNLPESRLIRPLVSDAARRTEAMVAAPPMQADVRVSRAKR